MGLTSLWEEVPGPRPRNQYSQVRHPDILSGKRYQIPDLGRKFWSLVWYSPGQVPGYIPGPRPEYGEFWSQGLVLTRLGSQILSENGILGPRPKHRKIQSQGLVLARHIWCSWQGQWFVVIDGCRSSVQLVYSMQDDTGCGMGHGAEPEKPLSPK